jgi:hypothetical protein
MDVLFDVAHNLTRTVILFTILARYTLDIKLLFFSSLFLSSPAMALRVYGSIPCTNRYTYIKLSTRLYFTLDWGWFETGKEK